MASQTILTWRSARGGEFLLTGDPGDSNSGVFVLPGLKGFEIPPQDLKYDELPGLDGALFRNVRTMARELFIPLFLWAPSRMELLALKRNLLAHFNPAFGPGTLYKTEPDNTSRYINCYYASGVEGDETEDQSGLTWMKMGVVLRALDPYWHDATTVEKTFLTGVSNYVPFFNDPFIGSAFLRADLSLEGIYEPDISGDVDSYPTWTIKGPANFVSLKNHTGFETRTLRLNAAIGTGEVVTITTEPGNRTVFSSVAGNLWAELQSPPDFWPVVPGHNVIEIEMPGATEDSQVTLAYRPRYLSA